MMTYITRHLFKSEMMMLMPYLPLDSITHAANPVDLTEKASITLRSIIHLISELPTRYPLTQGKQPRGRIE